MPRMVGKGVLNLFPVVVSLTALLIGFKGFKFKPKTFIGALNLLCLKTSKSAATMSMTMSMGVNI